MLKLSKTITNRPVLSLRTGGKVGVATDPIINPNNLKVEGWYCHDNFSNEKLVLLSSEVRDFVPDGVAVNDHDAMTELDDLIRLKDILEFEFKLIGKSVVTNHNRRLGKVADYALDPDTMKIQKLYVSRPVYKSLTEGQLSIDRKQIIEITNRKIIVRDVDIRVKSPSTATAPATS